MLARFPVLQAEVQRALSSVADLDVSVIVERFRPALQTASRLAVEIDTLDDAVRKHADMQKFVNQAHERLSLASASVYTEKLHTLTGKLTQAVASPSELGSAETSSVTKERAPQNEDDAILNRADEMYCGTDSESINAIHATQLYERLGQKNHAEALNRLYWVYSAQALNAKREPDEIPLLKKALDCLRRAADADHPFSMALLAGRLRGASDGKLGIQQSFFHCKTLAERAASLGCFEAWCELADLYLNEKYPEHNVRTAFDYMQRSAAAGLPQGWYQLGLLKDLTWKYPEAEFFPWALDPEPDSGLIDTSHSYFKKSIECATTYQRKTPGKYWDMAHTELVYEKK